MSRNPSATVDLAAVSVTTTQVTPPVTVPGIDPLDINNLTEPQAFAYLHEINEHITRRSVRMAVQNKDLVGVLIGGRNLFSRRACLTWMTGGAA